MKQQKTSNFEELTQQRLQEEALRVAKSIQTPGQTKEQTQLIAKGVEKGIAIYKRQQKAKARELDKAKKKAQKLKTSEAEVHENTESDSIEYLDLEHTKAKPALLTAGTIFSAAALIHATRYFLGWRFQLNDFAIPPSWSLLAVFVTASLAYWMFLAARD